MNINVHSQQDFWNLGLILFKNSMTAEACVEMVKKRISEHKLSLSEDIVCITTDGASTMTKVGKLITCHQQLCMAHGIQLAVTDVLYKKTSDLSSEATFQLGSSEGEEEAYIDDDTDATGDWILFMKKMVRLKFTSLKVMVYSQRFPR